MALVMRSDRSHYPMSYRYRVEPLQKSALAAVAGQWTITLRMRELEHKRGGFAKNILSPWSTTMEKAILNELLREVPVQLTRKIRDLMKRAKTMERLKRWMQFHYIHVFHERGDLYEMKNICDQLVWRGDGSIDYDTTARRLLDSDELDNLEKYYLATVADTMPLDIERWHRRLTRMQRKRVQFWLRNRVQNNGLGNLSICQAIKIIGWDYRSSCSALSYIRESMNYWTVLEFTREPVTRVIDAMARSQNTALLLRFLSTLTALELSEIASSAHGCWWCAKIMSVLSANPTYIRSAMIVWKYICDEMDWRVIVPCLQAMSSIDESATYVNDLLLEAWQWVPQSARRSISGVMRFTEAHPDDVQLLDITLDVHVFNPKLRDYCCVRGLRRDLRFLLEALPYFSVEYKSWYFGRNWYKLMIGASPKDFQKLMEMCLRQQEFVTRFKMNYMTSYYEHTVYRSYCELLSVNGLFNELNQFLRFCCSNNAQLVSRMKIQILMTREISKWHAWCDRPSRIDNFLKFLRDIRVDGNNAGLCKTRGLAILKNLYYLHRVSQKGDDLFHAYDMLLRYMLGFKSNLTEVRRSLRIFVPAQIRARFIRELR